MFKGDFKKHTQAQQNVKKTIAYVRSDLGFHEDEDEDKNRRYNARSHHPGREGLFITKGADEPTSLIRGRD